MGYIGQNYGKNRGLGTEVGRIELVRGKRGEIEKKIWRKEETKGRSGRKDGSLTGQY